MSACRKPRLTQTPLLRALAISAPHYEFARGADWHLGSQTPFSLLNALRGAFARLAEPTSAWSTSNWSDFDDRFQSIHMSDYLPECLAWLDEAMERARPNLVLIGAMSVSMPGALACARRVRARFGRECLIVLGGKHATETLWRTPDQTPLTHPSSPLSPPFRAAFDIVISGDAEEVIAEIGDIVARYPVGSDAMWEALRRDLVDLPGEHLVALAPHSAAATLLPAGRQRLIEPARYETVYAHYPVIGGFGVFGGRRTAHAYSYSSRGCIFRCTFCSESAEINGTVSAARLEAAAEGLAAQFTRLQAIAAPDDADRLSLFVEDSVFLQGHVGSWRRFAALREGHPVSPFGAQLTVDIILDDRRLDALRSLVAVGLRYVFIGLETGDEAVASDMSKNTRRGTPWRDRSQKALSRLAELGIDVGVSVLFGLGEDQATRMTLLAQLSAWRSALGQPTTVSLNWAVNHPLRRLEGTPQSFADWAVPQSDPRHRLIASLFGEASLAHCMPGTEPPTAAQLREIVCSYRRFNERHDEFSD